MTHIIIAIAARFGHFANSFAGVCLQLRKLARVACFVCGASVPVSVYSASPLLIDFTAHACSPDVSNCAQTGPANSSVFNLALNLTNAVTLRVAVTHFNSTLTQETVSFDFGPFAGGYQTVMGNQIALVFDGAGSSAMQLASVNSGISGPAGSFSTILFYSVPNLAAPLKLDAYFAVAAVPEPETYALLLAGFALVSVIARRRSRRCVAALVR